MLGANQNKGEFEEDKVLYSTTRKILVESLSQNQSYSKMLPKIVKTMFGFSFLPPYERGHVLIHNLL